MAFALAGCGESSGSPNGSPGSEGGTQDGTVSCGGSGEPCCNGTACNAGLTCSGATCSGSIQPEAGGDSGADVMVADAAGDVSSTDASMDSGNVALVDAAVDGPLGSDGGGAAGGVDGAVSDAAQGTSGADTGSDGADAIASACDSSMGWRCAVDTSCGPSSPTRLEGKVFDPAGANALYGAVVFIPNSPGTLPVISPGTQTCNTCDVPVGDYVVATQTDASGSFTLDGVPTGTGVPVTVQIGKWRRTVAVNIPASCAQTSVPDGILRLPRNRSEGDMPQMALLTGGCDDVGCFMMNMGIDPAEFTAPHAGGRLDVYQGLGLLTGAAASLSGGTAGNCTTSSCPLWASKQALENYDIAILSCECGENTSTKPAASMQAMRDWLDEGGRVLASHYHYVWFEDSPAAELQGVATWGQTGSNDLASGSGNYDIDTSFPKGATFAQWLALSSTTGGDAALPTIALSPVADSVDAVNATPPQATTRWIYDSAAGGHPKYMSFETPIGGFAGADSGARAYCGKAAFTDLHTTSGLLATAASIPSDCAKAPLTAQEKALEYLFFDLSGCVSDDRFQTPPPPPPR